MSDTLQEEYTKIAYQTPGECYFINVQQIATRLIITRGGCWQVQENHVGGRGDMAQVVDITSGASINLWNDARGRWWLEDENGNIDLAATKALVPKWNDDIRSVSDEHIRPTWQDLGADSRCRYRGGARQNEVAAISHHQPG